MNFFNVQLTFIYFNYKNNKNIPSVVDSFALEICAVLAKLAPRAVMSNVKNCRVKK